MTPPAQRKTPRGSAAKSASTRRTPTAARILVDTGVLVAMFDRLDSHHEAAAAWVGRSEAALLTVVPVLTKASFFLPTRLRAALAGLAVNGTLELHHPNAAGYARVAQLFTKYADQNPDWADMELVWLAESTGISRIATLDIGDFSVYRIHGRKRFELELLR
ncbi:MAG TPA: PIN domain-containing protein [Caldimonas sp.]|nr:PIN domain-containing protein [Caldimonas sp.]